MLSLNIHKFWQKRNFLNYALLSLSTLWLLLSYLRKLQPAYKSSLFVICIGNLNLGGSGKTPTAELLAKMLKAHNYSAIFLSKGYKGSATKPTWVKSSHSALEVGDEALLLSKILPTIVAKKLKAGLKFLEKSQSAPIVILDDGYQNPSIYKHFNILVINGCYQFGNKFIFPAGPLRETISSGILKANAIVVLENKPKDLIKLVANSNIYYGSYQASSTNIPKKVLAFCGIAIPEKFLKTLQQNNIVVDKFLSYPDHYQYQDKDFAHIIKMANKLPILTTDKDYVKVPKKYISAFISYKIYLELNNQENLLQQVITQFKKHHEKNFSQTQTKTN